MLRQPSCLEKKEKTEKKGSAAKQPCLYITLAQQQLKLPISAAKAIGQAPKLSRQPLGPLKLLGSMLSCTKTKLQRSSFNSATSLSQNRPLRLYD